MKISLFDIAKGISWTDDKKIHFHEKNSADLILIEYLNDISIEDISNDIHTLWELNKILITNNKELIETYLIENLHGFSEYEDGYYAFISGATDKSPSILYDYNNNVIFLTHPNFSIKEKFFISISNLIDLLTLKKKLIIVLDNQ